MIANCPVLCLCYVCCLFHLDLASVLKFDEDDVQRKKIAAFSKDIGEYVLCGQLINMTIMVTQLKHKAKLGYITAIESLPHAAWVPNKPFCTQQHADTKVMRFINLHENQRVGGKAGHCVFSLHASRHGILLKRLWHMTGITHTAVHYSIHTAKVSGPSLRQWRDCQGNKRLLHSCYCSSALWRTAMEHRPTCFGTGSRPPGHAVKLHSWGQTKWGI